MIGVEHGVSVCELLQLVGTFRTIVTHINLSYIHATGKRGTKCLREREKERERERERERDDIT